jgi:hypothetical protein
MANLISKIKRFIRSPQGQRMITEAQRQAAKPENRRKLEQLRQRVIGRRRHK